MIHHFGIQNLAAGEKISPIEVDAVLLSHPDIAQAVAFGVPDDKYGEEVSTILCCQWFINSLLALYKHKLLNFYYPL